MREDLFLIPGTTSGFTIGQSTYSNSTLKYWSYNVELRGFGTLNPGVDINFLDEGGFEFINGYKIQELISCVLHFYKYTPIASTSNYTNGIDIISVLPELENRIGWRQPRKAASPVLNSYNKTSKSGRYFDGFHAMVTVNNIKAVQEDDSISDADFNQYLTDVQDDAIMRTLSEVFRESSLIEQKLLYTRVGVSVYLGYPELMINELSKVFKSFLHQELDRAREESYAKGFIDGHAVTKKHEQTGLEGGHESLSNLNDKANK